MIHVDRDRTDETGVPIRPDASWFDLARAATDKALEQAGAHVAESRVYAHPQVRAALENIFHEKCAYCEAEIIGGGEWDVDHFRPKGRVAERTDHPGYYWLAYEWTNLYPACKFCNQRRRDRPRWRDLRWAGAGGKQDQFPLGDESTRAMSPSDPLRLEDVLLLDPCSEHPESYLGFTLQGWAVSKGGNTKGRSSIDVFFLNRRPLRSLRKKRVDRTIELLRMIRGLENQGNISAAADLRDFLERHFLSDASPFAAAARAVVEDPDAFGV